METRCERTRRLNQSTTGQIDEAARHRDVGDVHRPDLVGPLDLHSAQEIRINLVARRGFGRVRLAIDRLDAHPLHHRRHALAADVDPFPIEKIAQHPGARERMLEMQFIDAAHQSQSLQRQLPGLVIDAAPADVQSLRLTRDGKIVGAIDHRFALSMPALLSAPDKKSFSSASSPILA